MAASVAPELLAALTVHVAARQADVVQHVVAHRLQEAPLPVAFEPGEQQVENAAERSDRFLRRFAGKTDRSLARLSAHGAERVWSFVHNLLLQRRSKYQAVLRSIR